MCYEALIAPAEKQYVARCHRVNNEHEFRLADEVALPGDQHQDGGALDAVAAPADNDYDIGEPARIDHYAEVFLHRLHTQADRDGRGFRGQAAARHVNPRAAAAVSGAPGGRVLLRCRGCLASASPLD